MILPDVWMIGIDFGDEWRWLLGYDGRPRAYATRREAEVLCRTLNDGDPKTGYRVKCLREAGERLAEEAARDGIDKLVAASMRKIEAMGQPPPAAKETPQPEPPPRALRHGQRRVGTAHTDSTTTLTDVTTTLS